MFNVYCDGGARGNPGPAAAAFVVKDASGQVIHRQGTYLGIATNNQAEYQAVIESLKWLSTMNYELTTVNYYLDSQLVVNQLMGRFKIKDQTLKIKYLEIMKLIASHKLTIAGFAYIPRAQNSIADFQVNLTLDQKSSV